MKTVMVAARTRMRIETRMTKTRIMITAEDKKEYDKTAQESRAVLCYRKLLKIFQDFKDDIIGERNRGKEEDRYIIPFYFA